MQPVRLLSSLLADLPAESAQLFSAADIAPAFPALDRKALTAVLGRAVRAGHIKRVCHGLYCPRTMKPRGVLLYLVAAKLRAGNFNYLSLESVLSDAGVISQIPINWIAVMSSGRSHITRCGDFGTIEFVHTKKRPTDVLNELSYDPLCRLWRASVRLALQDMKRTRRNLDLVDWHVIDERS